MTNAAPISRLRRNLWIAAASVVLFTVTGFFVLPPILKIQLEKRASAALGRTVTIGRVRVNPYAAAVTIEQLDVRLKKGDGTFLGWDRLYLNLEPVTSLFGTWTVGAIELDGFHVTALLQPDGTFNFSDILANLSPPAGPAPAAPAAPGRPLHIGSLKVNSARVDFADQSRKLPFATTLGPVSFVLTDFRTTGSRGAPGHFEAVTEGGEKFTWTGTVNADPVSSTGELQLENIVLAKYAAYYSHLMRTDVVAGKLSLHSRYEINLAAGQRRVRLLDGAVSVRELRLVERAGQQPYADFPSVEVTGLTADALAESAALQGVSLKGGSLRLRRDPDGSINVLKLLQSELATTVQTTVQAKAPDVRVGEVALQDFQVDVTDLAGPRPAQLSLGGIQVSLKNFTLADGAVMPLQLALQWAPQGTVKMTGKVSLIPELKADLQADVAGLAILPLSPYLEQFLNARITQGTVSTAGSVQVAMAGGAPAITYAGEVQVEKFGLVDGAHNEELAGFGALALTGLKATTAPELTVALAEVKVTAPYARVVVNADQSLNLAAVAKVGGSSETVGGALRPDSAEPSGHSSVAKAKEDKQAPPTVPADAAAAPTIPEPKIEIAKVVITDGDFTLADRSVVPNVRMAINQFAGTITGLSSSHLARGNVELHATVDGVGPIRITGQLDPFGRPRYADLQLDFKNVDLLPLSPYSGKYAGFELARGKLALDIQAHLEDRKVEMSNVITLNQFNFGARVDSPDATGLPVRLGVALLKDSNGQIVLDVPVSGSLDDPSFRVGKVVLRVIINLLTKAAVSPFALLGSMFGGGGDELAFQEFVPGGSALLPAETKKLDTMVKALVNRPGLSVALEGSYDGPADTYVLRQQKLAAIVRRAIWEAKHAVDPNIAPPEKLALTPAEEADMVKKLFDEKFPPGTQFGAPLAAAPVVAAPPPAAKKGLIGRVVAVVTFKNKRSDKSPAAEKSAAPAVPALADATGPSLVEMTGRLAETMGVTDDDLRALAQQRAQQVRDYFITTGKIDPERLFLAKEREATTDAAKAGKGPRVFLTLQ
jgi:hypothetical protein